MNAGNEGTQILRVYGMIKHDTFSIVPNRERFKREAAELLPVVEALCAGFRPDNVLNILASMRRDQ